jgi:outer membrane biosynthesis protein TonB
MTNVSDQRVLRVGVIQQGRIVEERLMRKPGPVTIGPDAKNTVIATLPAGISQVKLFDFQGGEYVLQFDETTQGRVSVGDKVLDLETLRREKLVQRQGAQWRLPIGGTSRGRVSVGDLVLLFQFVAAPAITEPRLPANLKTTWDRRFEAPLLAILAVSFIIQAGTAGALDVWWEKTGKYLERPRRSSADVLRPLILEIERKKQEEPEPPKLADKETEVPKKEEPTKVVEVPKPKDPPKVEQVTQVEPPRDLNPNEPPKSRVPTLSEEDYAKAKDKVSRSTILRHLGSAGPGETGAFEDSLARGVTQKALDEAFDTNGVRVASASDKVEFRGGPKRGEESKAFTTVSAKEISGPAVKTVTTEAKAETAVKVSVSEGSLGPPVGTGTLDSGSVKGVFSRRKSAIRMCYEDSLRGAPNTEGKVKVRFTIGPAGRITDIDVVENTTGNSKLADCIVSKVRGWPFDKPENGSVTYTYPFILSKSN